MLFEIHILQNHAPSNLNRDDTGSPKECVFGGYTRARISSQCLKRTVRRSDAFQQALGADGLATRTRRLPEIVRQRLTEAGFAPDIAAFAAERVSGVGNNAEKATKPRDGKFSTAQTMFLTQRDIEAVVEAVKELASDKNLSQFKAVFAPKKGKKSGDEDDGAQDDGGTKIQRLAQAKGFRPVTVDVALFGRMTTSEAFRDVEAACQVAHALSTHKVDHEFDYFTAVDDLQGTNEEEQEEDSGADMIGDVEFNSACYYKYFSVDAEGLVDNLTGRRMSRPDIPAEDSAAARALTGRALVALLRAAVTTTPTGKQNSFAAHQLPSLVLVEARPYPTPVSYANAFVEPVRTPKDGSDLTRASLGKLATHVEALTAGFNLEATARLLLAPEDPQFAIPGVERVPNLNTLCARLQTLAQASPEVPHV